MLTLAASADWSLHCGCLALLELGPRHPRLGACTGSMWDGSVAAVGRGGGEALDQGMSPQGGDSTCSFGLVSRLLLLMRNRLDFPRVRKLAGKPPPQCPLDGSTSRALSLLLVSFVELRAAGPRLNGLALVAHQGPSRCMGVTRPPAPRLQREGPVALY